MTPSFITPSLLVAGAIVMLIAAQLVGIRARRARRARRAAHERNAELAREVAAQLMAVTRRKTTLFDADSVSHYQGSADQSGDGTPSARQIPRR